MVEALSSLSQRLLFGKSSFEFSSGSVDSLVAGSEGSIAAINLCLVVGEVGLSTGKSVLGASDSKVKLTDSLLSDLNVILGSCELDAEFISSVGCHSKVVLGLADLSVELIELAGSNVDSSFNLSNCLLGGCDLNGDGGNIHRLGLESVKSLGNGLLSSSDVIDS